MNAALVLREKGVAYWRHVPLMMPAVVPLEGAEGAVVTTDIARLGATLVGVAISQMLVAIMWPLRRGRTAEVRESVSESTG